MSDKPKKSDDLLSNILHLQFAQEIMQKQMNKIDPATQQIEINSNTLLQKTDAIKELIKTLQPADPEEAKQLLDNKIDKVAYKISEEINQEIIKAVSKLNVATNRAEEVFRNLNTRNWKRRILQISVIFLTVIISGSGAGYLTANYIDTSKQAEANKMGLIMKKVWPQLNPAEKMRIAELADSSIILEKKQTTK